MRLDGRRAEFHKRAPDRIYGRGSAGAVSRLHLIAAVHEWPLRLATNFGSRPLMRHSAFTAPSVCYPRLRCHSPIYLIFRFPSKADYQCQWVSTSDGNYAALESFRITLLALPKGKAASEWNAYFVQCYPERLCNSHQTIRPSTNLYVTQINPIQELCSMTREIQSHHPPRRKAHLHSSAIFQQ